MSKKKLAAIIVACTIAIIVIVVIATRPPTAPTPAQNYTLTTHISPSGAGSISPSGGEYESGVQVTLTASPASGYTFDYWSGSASGTTSTTTITMDSDMSLTAHFEIIPTTPEVLFSDDFSDESSGWFTSDDDNGRVAYVNGCLYIMDYTYPEAGNRGNCQRYFTDFVLEVETWLVGGTDYNWHLVECRMQDTGNYYDFGITADGYYDIVKFVNGNPIELVSPTYSSYINQGMDAVNLIHIECIGSSLSLSVNGHLLAEVTDTTFTGGDIGLAANAQAGTFTEVAFDNIIVTEPTPTPTPTQFNTYSKYGFSFDYSKAFSVEEFGMLESEANDTSGVVQVGVEENEDIEFFQVGWIKMMPDVIETHPGGLEGALKDTLESGFTGLESDEGVVSFERGELVESTKAGHLMFYQYYTTTFTEGDKVYGIASCFYFDEGLKVFVLMTTSNTISAKKDVLEDFQNYLDSFVCH